MVYWEQNGRVLKATEPHRAIAQKITAGKKVSEWIEQKEAGHWECRLYATDEGLYLVKVWQPALGLSWEELQIIKLIL
ncbi:MAG: hypothetical protein QW607_09710 [Desulfurococcaceae archaeon]